MQGLHSIMKKQTQTDGFRIKFLMNMLVKSDNLAITGEGTTELLDTRLNTNVTANTLEITKAAVKNLNCKNLLIEEEGNKLVVAEYLNFEKASLNPHCELYAEPGSYLKLGEIDCTKFDEKDNLTRCAR